MPLMVMVQEPVVQAPLHVMKFELLAGVALRVTVKPLTKEAEHVGGQLMPAGDDVIVPLPVPGSETVSVKSGSTVIDTVAGALVSEPSLTVNVKLSGPV